MPFTTRYSSGYARVSRLIFRCFLVLVGILFGWGIHAKAAVAALELNGLAVYEELGEEQFIGALYLDTLTQDNKAALLADERKQMVIKVVSDRLLQRKFRRLWLEGVANNLGATDQTQYAQNLADFVNLLRFPLQQNDTLVIERRFRQRIDVSVNNVLLGSISNPAFFDVLLRTWIGPVPLSSDFRSGILRAGSIDIALLTRFNGVRTTQERVDAVREWAAQQSTSSQSASLAEVSSQSSRASSARSRSSVSQASSLQVSSRAQGVSSFAASSAKPANEEPVRSLPVSPAVTEAGDDESFTAATLLSRQLFISQLTRWTARQVKFPASALKRGQQGTVRIQVKIGRNGAVLDTLVLGASPHNSLNKAALQAIKDANPFPPMPDVIQGESFEFTVPIAFTLKDSDD
jgi:periplasmic protein TonB